MISVLRLVAFVWFVNVILTLYRLSAKLHAEDWTEKSAFSRLIQPALRENSRARATAFSFSCNAFRKAADSRNTI
jgi:hypothetical protein